MAKPPIERFHMMVVYEDKDQRHYADTEREGVLAFDGNDFESVFSWPEEIILTIESALK